MIMLLGATCDARSNCSIALNHLPCFIRSSPFLRISAGPLALKPSEKLLIFGGADLLFLTLLGPGTAVGFCSPPGWALGVAPPGAGVAPPGAGRCPAPPFFSAACLARKRSWLYCCAACTSDIGLGF